MIVSAADRDSSPFEPCLKCHVQNLLSRGIESGAIAQAHRSIVFQAFRHFNNEVLMTRDELALVSGWESRLKELSECLKILVSL